MKMPVSQVSSSIAFNPTRTALLETFALDAAIVRGTGYRLFDAEGREYLDFLSQYGALPFGHNPPELWEALAGAGPSELPSMIQPLRPVEAERLAGRLAALTPGDLEICTFANSGAEAVEAAIKLARARTGRDLILSTTNGFHGKTLGALSATGKPLYQSDFARAGAGLRLRALRRHRRARRAAERPTATRSPPSSSSRSRARAAWSARPTAISTRPSSSAGATACSASSTRSRPGSAAPASSSCRRGREAPDMLLLAKALGGGLMPIGACIVRPEVWDDRFGLLHSSTFANNNLACRVASATLDLLERDDRRIVRDVAANGAYLRDRLEGLREAYPDAIREVRGRGYMVGLEFARFDRRDNSATMAFCSLNRGVTPLFSSYLFNVHGSVDGAALQRIARAAPAAAARRGPRPDRPGRRRARRTLRGDLCDATTTGSSATWSPTSAARPTSPAWAAPADRSDAPGATEIPQPNTFGFLHPLHRRGRHHPFRPVICAVLRRGALGLAGLGQAARPGLRAPRPTHPFAVRRDGRWLDHVDPDAARGHARPVARAPRPR